MRSIKCCLRLSPKITMDGNERELENGDHSSKLSIVLWPFYARETLAEHYKITFLLAPPAGRQRSFSNADSSVVVRRRPSSSVVVRRQLLT